MNWKTCKTAALAKMFGSREGVIDTQAGINRDFLTAMPYAATEALHRICDAGVPLRCVLEVKAEGGRAVMVDLEEEAPDFKSEGSCLEVTVERPDGRIEAVERAQIYLGRFLLLPAGVEGTVRMAYDAWPAEITPETPDDFLLPLRPDANSLVPLYIAGSLYKDEDPAVATIFMNEFESKLNDLSAAQTERRSGSFSSVTGWCGV